MPFEKLNKVYRNHYKDTGCDCYKECGGGLIWPHGSCFYKAKVGAKYGTTGGLKLLFVGKEGTGEGNLSKSSIYEPAIITDVPNNNYHYFGTIYTAVRILTDEKPESTSRIDLLKYNSIQHFFALTNYFKCAFKESENNNHIAVSKTMKEKCPKILLDEIECLRPDVIVVQGKFTNKVFWSGLKALSKQECDDAFVSGKISVTKYHYSDGTPFFVIWSFHPCAPGRRWYNNLDCLEQAIEFVKNEFTHSI